MIFRKKNNKNNITVTKGISGIGKKINLNKFIIKIGGVKNIDSVSLKDERVNIKVLDSSKIDILYFRNNPGLIGLFLKNDILGFVIHSNPKDFLDKLKNLCNL